MSSKDEIFSFSDIPAIPDAPGIPPDSAPAPEPSLSPAQPPRYVPVLNEIVGTLAPAAPILAVPDGRVEAVAQAVLCALGPEFDQRLAETMSRVLHEQLQGLHTRVRQAITREVRSAIMASLAELPLS